MEQLETISKDISITFKVTSEMDKELRKLMKKKNWKKSAFIRVAIQKELDRIKNESK